MEKKKYILPPVAPKSGYKVPDGYFDQITSRVMDQLPQPEVEEMEQEEHPPLTLWGKLRPVLYMAAMFAGIAFMLKVVDFKGTKGETTEAVALTEAESEVDAMEGYTLYAGIDEYTLVEYICNE